MPGASTALPTCLYVTAASRPLMDSVLLSGEGPAGERTHHLEEKVIKSSETRNKYPRLAPDNLCI